jgi:zinc transport system substrate-binding protein
MLFLGLCAFCFSVLAETAPLSVTVTILPQKFFVERIGGEHVRVSVLVGPGQSPETFEPLPRQMALLSGSSLFYRIGVPFEDVWMEGLRSTHPELVFLDAREGITLREMETAGGHHHDDEDAHHAHGGADPHIWLNPANVRIMSDHLRDQLITLDPQHAADYRDNHTRFTNELVELEQSLQAQLNPLKGLKFMVFHPSWGYFADAFQLRQLPIESEGKEPGARTLMRLIEQARHESIRVIFVQQQFSIRQAKALANAINGQLITLDPLAESYFDNMRKVAAAIREAYQ